MTVVVGYVPTATGFLAVTEAEREARSLGVSVVIVNVLGDVGYRAPTAADEKNLDAVVEHLKQTGVDHRIRQITGADSAAEAIMTVAEEEQAKLIVLGLHRRSRLQKALLGSTVQAVVLGSPVPVLSVPNVDE